MDRRAFLGAAALMGGLPLLARAHHGWSGFDSTPLYLAGTASAVRWQNPHAELVLRPTAGLVLPSDLSQRSLPAQTAPIDTADLLARTRLAEPADREWVLELAPLFRLNAWQMPMVEDGERVEAIGYRATRGERLMMRVEYLTYRGQTYGLRSSPA